MIETPRGWAGLVVKTHDLGVCSSQGLRFKSLSANNSCVGRSHTELCPNFNWVPTSRQWDLSPRLVGP